MSLRKRWSQRQILLAVHDQDLRQFLTSLGILNGVEEGKFNCAVCQRKITLENLGGVYPENLEIRIVCEFVNCVAHIKQKDQI